VKSALWGFELKSEKNFGVGKFFVCDRDFFHFCFGSSEKKSEKSEKMCVTAALWIFLDGWCSPAT